MNPFSIYPAFCVILIALLFLWLFNNTLKLKVDTVKYNTVDGLRGYLAFFVFLHHSSVYYTFLRTWRWESPHSNIYIHLGETSVSMFFMITGFLFFSKLIDSRTKKIDWLKLYISRILRLYPLYLVLLSIIIVSIGFLTHFTLVESPKLVFKEILNWFGFAVFNDPRINGFVDTGGMMAGVLWSLKYEWLFYFSLPLFGLLFFKSKPSILTLLITATIFYFIFSGNYLRWEQIYAFAGGIGAAFMVRNERVRTFSATTFSSILILLCLGAVVTFFNTAYEYIPMSLISIAFILIACGNTLFGILEMHISKLLGQLSYGIYLLHGLTLYFTFIIIIGHEEAAKYSLLQHWLVICTCSLFLILISMLAHKFIELPFIKSVDIVTTKVKNIAVYIQK